ncbi:hypothetical protein BJX76DRAFT_328360 [Aspergillus varians]
MYLLRFIREFRDGFRSKLGSVPWHKLTSGSCHLVGLKMLWPGLHTVVGMWWKDVCFYSARRHIESMGVGYV